MVIVVPSGFTNPRRLVVAVGTEITPVAMFIVTPSGCTHPVEEVVALAQFTVTVPVVPPPLKPVPAVTPVIVPPLPPGGGLVTCPRAVVTSTILAKIALRVV